VSIRSRLFVALGSAIVVVAALAGVLALNASRSAEAQEVARLHGEDLLAHLGLSIAVHGFVDQAADVLVRGAPEEKIERSLRDIDARFEAISDTRAGMAQISEDADDFDEEGATTAKMRESFDRMVTDYRAAVAARRGGARLSDPDVDALFDVAFRQDFVARMNTSVEAERQDGEEASREFQRISRQMFVVSLVIGAVAVLVLVLLGATLFRSISRGITALLAGADRVAAGDLDYRIAGGTKDEFGVIALAFDGMTEKLREAQIARQLRMEKLVAVGRLSASIGHELRNPLGAIRNAHHYLTKRVQGSELGEDARVAQFLGVMDKEIAVCSRIISDLLDFARERAISRSVCPLRPLVDDAISLVQAARPIRIDNEVSDDLPVPSLDQDQFRQVLVNLIQNAAEAIPADREGRVRVAAGAAGGKIRLRVIDNGAGIAEENLRVILEPLFTTKSKGTGLGLSIVDGIVKRHGGKLHVESELGAGTTFTIELPIDEAHDPTALAASSPRSAR
jgi:signal transduction histidine kinase